MTIFFFYNGNHIGKMFSIREPGKEILALNKNGIVLHKMRFKKIIGLCMVQML